MLRSKELHIRAALFQAMRKFFSSQDFLEVDTPIRQPVIIPESNIEPLLSGAHFLQTSPELCMKRLIASGCSSIFQICPCFRKEERGRRHLEEFSMLEWYRSNASYLDLMTDCEKLLQFVAGELTKRFTEVKMPVDFTAPWQRLSLTDAFKRWSPKALPLALTDSSFDEILVEYIEPQLGLNTPTFLYDYPVELASLAQTKESDPTVAERFELYIGGLELANGFSELIDPVEQRRRFEIEIATFAKNHNRQMEMPDTLLKALGNMPKTAGIALGLDRLFMLIIGKDHIGDAVTFSPVDLL